MGLRDSMLPVREAWAEGRRHQVAPQRARGLAGINVSGVSAPASETSTVTVVLATIGVLLSLYFFYKAVTE